MRATQIPARILVGTDLTARCDRALGRAMQLAGQWKAEILVVHAVDPGLSARHDSFAAPLPSWRRSLPLKDQLGERLQADLRAANIEAASQVAEGIPGEVLLQAAKNWRAELTILGAANDHPAHRSRLGSTVDRLIREGPTPVLCVRSRPLAPYTRLLAASDLSLSSRAAVVTAPCWFSDTQLTLFHAYHHPGADSAGPELLQRWQYEASSRCRDFLGAVGSLARRSPEWQCLAELGTPETLLTDLLRHAAFDLVVLGTEGRRGFRCAMLGSTAEHLLHLLDCDTLVVRTELNVR